MKRIPVSSSNLVSVGYEKSNKTLEVEFRNRRIYQYKGVPESIFKGLLLAVSKGKYLHRFVEKKYPYLRIR
ncbi:MAG: KTSC domain-containing protein [Candidatus Altiarchaeota archaeon]|nr:KTSC domain-containing protein [Candidatus Altiarchaeota archaeon]